MRLCSRELPIATGSPTSMLAASDLLLQVTNAILLANLLVSTSFSRDAEMVALSAGDVEVDDFCLAGIVAALESVASPFGGPSGEAGVP